MKDGSVFEESCKFYKICPKVEILKKLLDLSDKKRFGDSGCNKECNMYEKGGEKDGSNKEM